ncbi:hypothetical protein VOLCADRAFT_120807 [Volvox carteri f. nagariensis]|uniref:BHLH domain-containing protein n=1 Tax=Volvox carteri f. nagariensis TaxID=3068 RepID=D8TTQ6_VOLCA|nr:uncharacterized protein VOLCADRAFT_120807 [Volvox carteri f. nagariensis]EFJ49237.1 hypothetical protein VOLCADRAFT_120807 [Volvox carteri f. nagariensis]|eukprot:XP_002949685.1 hypothetical protein VOLCADRAFT_120807 [Volvox carteri f. nagariensis]
MTLGKQYNPTDRDLQLAGLRNVGKTRSSDSRSSSAYASRHQAAEQRRRTRINERQVDALKPWRACDKKLELLRKLVPHAERANTACFLEEVIKYIEALKRRTMELETMLEAATGKPVAKSLGTQGVPSSGACGSSALEPHQQSPQLQLASAVSSQLAHLLPGGGGPQGQQNGLGALFPHSGGALSLAGGSLSLGGNGNGGAANTLSLAQLTAGLQAHQHLSGAAAAASLLPHSHSQLTSSASLTQQHLNDLQTMQVMHSLHQHQQQQQQQQARAAAVAAAPGGHLSLHAAHTSSHHSAGHPPPFLPTNNKAFLHFNEDLFGGLKPEQLVPSRSLLGAAASTTPSTSMQLTSAHLPTDSNTLAQAETRRKTLSGSPVSSEESGVPLKKRKILML